mgnify:FL=1
MAATSASHGALHASATSRPARIGPNSLIQTREVVRLYHGLSTWEILGAEAGLPAELPETMVDERLFRRLVEALVDLLGTESANRVLTRSGERTADYVRRNRIPAPVRVLLRLLPRGMATRLLLRSISRHAWTFVGSGRMEHDPDTIVIHDCPTCRDVPAEHPMGGFYVGAFQGLLQSLADPRIRVTETRCIARGDPACVFELHPSSPTVARSGADNPPG